MNGPHTDAAIRLHAYRLMVSHGYLRRIAGAGSRLERWYHYLEQLGRPGPLPHPDPHVQPRIFPAMSGLVTPAWRDASVLPAAAMLEQAAHIIGRELAAVDESRRLSYAAPIVGSGQWSVLPLFAFGEEASTILFSRNMFPETTGIVQSLPDNCTALPLADTIFSAHTARTRLLPHFSWDPFRLRLHLGLSIPRRCGIRVGAETRAWQQGRVLAFHDAHEHDTWNESEQTRIVLIVDLWHPDLTPIEREAILACFRKKEIRSVLMRSRTPPGLQALFIRKFDLAEAHDPLIGKYWAA